MENRTVSYVLVKVLPLLIVSVVVCVSVCDAGNTSGKCPFPSLHITLENYCDWSHWLPWNCTCCGSNVGSMKLARRLRGLCCNETQTLVECLVYCGYKNTDDKEFAVCKDVCPQKTDTSICAPTTPTTSATTTTSTTRRTTTAKTRTPFTTASTTRPATTTTQSTAMVVSIITSVTTATTSSSNFYTAPKLTTSMSATLTPIVSVISDSTTSVYGENDHERDFTNKTSEKRRIIRMSVIVVLLVAAIASACCLLVAAVTWRKKIKARRNSVHDAKCQITMETKPTAMDF